VNPSLYRTIVADPPWTYDEGFLHGRQPGWRKRKAAGIPESTLTEIRRKPMPYPTMSVGEIAALPIAALADANAALFLWTTNRYLPDSFVIASAWGFSYRQMLVWDKRANASPFGGAVARNSAEFLLVCKRGDHRWIGRAADAILSVSRTRHSKKPEAFLDLVESVSPGPYLELFARRQRLGWDTWGQEAFGHVDLDDHEVIEQRYAT
jgi:N6-adenosine-specific RNA methylase IME4